MGAGVRARRVGAVGEGNPGVRSGGVDPGRAILVLRGVLSESRTRFQGALVSLLLLPLLLVTYYGTSAVVYYDGVKLVRSWLSRSHVFFFVSCVLGGYGSVLCFCVETALRPLAGRGGGSVDPCCGNLHAFLVV